MEARNNFDSNTYRFLEEQEDSGTVRKTGNAAQEVSKKGKRPRIRKPLFSVTFAN